MNSKLNADNLNAGHRQRLFNRFSESGFRGMADHEILELILFSVILRRDVKPLAKNLLLRFGSVAAVLDAEKSELLKISGVGERVAAQLKLFREIVTLYAKQTRLEGKPLNSGRAVADFARAKIGSSPYENFLVIFLNNQNKLIDCDVTPGTVNRAAVYPRNIAKRALELHACAVILAHNHPGGSVAPSAEDVAVTNVIGKALSAVEVKLIDHVVVTTSDYASMRAMGAVNNGDE